MLAWVLVVAMAGCGGADDEPDAPDEGPIGQATEALSKLSCQPKEAKGYKNGTAFTIKVVTVDGKLVERDTANAYYFMARAAAEDGVEIRVVSGFRTMEQQKYLYNCYLTCSCNGCNLAAKPGYSNHQSGSALDLNTSASGVYAWLNAHAKKFGFYRTVPSEAWHWEYKGPRPVGGPCGKLGGKLAKAWSDAPKDPSGKADYAVCAGDDVRLWLKLTNNGTARWADKGKNGKYVGERVRLSSVGGKDALTGSKEVSVGANANDDVRPASWGGGGGKACSDKDGCRTTVFTKKGLAGKAPAKPGLYSSSWRLHDESPVWKDAKAFGPKVTLRFKVEACEAPTPLPLAASSPDEPSEGAGLVEDEDLDSDLGIEDIGDGRASGEPGHEEPVEGEAGEASGCSASGAPPSGPWALGALALALLVVRRRRLAVLGAVALLGCGDGGRAPAEERTATVSEEVKAPLAKAYCSISVIGKGTKKTEEDYLPHVITCENGGAGYQALKAQAIAARSVAYYNMATQGKICDGQGCQVYSCGAKPSQKAYDAVKATSGIYLSYGGMLTYGFYVDGNPKTTTPSCIGGSSWPTEKYVTYNKGKTGKQVKQTPLGYIGPPGYGQNRGCMSQWGSRCLENKKGYAYEGILEFYYGADIERLKAKGSCVGIDDMDEDGVADDEDNCKEVANASQKDLDGDGKGDACDADDDGDGIKDATDNCPKTKNAAQTDTDGDGKGDKCDADDDDDGVPDGEDNCPLVPNADQLDGDGDGTGDACDGTGETSVAADTEPHAGEAALDGGGDSDGDGVPDAEDPCPDVADGSTLDTDEDGLGDACDDDDDGDGIPDVDDPCPTYASRDPGAAACAGGEATEEAAAGCSVSRAGTRAGYGWLVLAALGVAMARRRVGNLSPAARARG
jgi:MYXO-CTERM domain-containing protein